MAANGERVWVWATRACAVGGFVTLVGREGFDAPPAFYLVLLGLFFGYDALKGRIKLIVQDDDDEKPDA